MDSSVVYLIDNFENECQKFLFINISNELYVLIPNVFIDKLYPYIYQRTGKS